MKIYYRNKLFWSLFVFLQTTQIKRINAKLQFAIKIYRIQQVYIILPHMSTTLPQYCNKCSWLFSKMGACQPPGVSIIFSFVSFIPYLLIFLFIALSLFSRGNRQIKMAALLITSYIVGDRILKNIVMMPRPEGACKASYGFPSSHMVVMCCYIFELFRYSNKSQKFFFIFLAVSQGMARVHLKYHTWTQVFGGISFALVYTIFFNIMFQKFEKIEFVKQMYQVLGVEVTQPNDKKKTKEKKL